MRGCSVGLVAIAAAVVAVLWLRRRWSGRGATEEERRRERGWAGAIRGAGTPFLGPMAGAAPLEFVVPPAAELEPGGEHVERYEDDDPRPEAP